MKSICSAEKRNITDDESRLLIFRARELCARGENYAVASSFLTPSEQKIVYDAIKSTKEANRLFFWGGFFGAERRIAVFLPSWLAPEKDSFETPFSSEREAYFTDCICHCGAEEVLHDFISPLKLSGSGFCMLTHRDWLGSVMGLGVKRNVLGDIACDDDKTLLFAKNTCADFICESLKKAGKDSVKAEKTTVDLSFSPKREYKEISATVASMRVDGVIHALCNISRSEASQIISSGFVQLNYSAVTELSATVATGDVISVRGLGKFIIDSSGEKTSKGRLRLKARKFI